MDKALIVLENTNKLKRQSVWRPDLFLLAMNQDMILPPQHKINIKRLKLTGDSVVNILPFLKGEIFDQFMQHIGAFLWKKAEQEHLSADEAKILLLLVLQRPGLENLLMSYLTQWEADHTQFPFHLYSVGLGYLLRLSHFSGTPKLLFYKQMSRNQNVLIGPHLPVIYSNNTNSCFFNEDEFEAVTDHISKMSMIPHQQMTPENLFYIKLTSTASRILNHGWSEAWAYALSALDHYEPSYDCYHNLMCFIALIAGKSSLSQQIVLRALEEARLHDSMVEHTWQRLSTLQKVCIHWGYFDLEDEVYQYADNLMAQKTDHHYTLIRQHMESLMQQCENILLYINLRFRYHASCLQEANSTCDKPLNLDYSYMKVDSLLAQMEMLTSKLKLSGEKEFYKGIIHHYKTHKPVADADSADTLNRQIGTKFLALANKLLKANDFRHVQAQILLKAAENGPHSASDMETMLQHIDKVTLNRWSPEAADMVFQSGFFMFAYQTHFTSGKKHIKLLKKVYRKATHNLGYRKNLIHSADRIMSLDDFTHSSNPEIPDYPNLEDCFGQEDKGSDMANYYWYREKETNDAKLAEMLQHFKMEASSSSTSPTIDEANLVLVTDEEDETSDDEDTDEHATPPPPPPPPTPTQPTTPSTIAISSTSFSVPLEQHIDLHAGPPPAKKSRTENKQPTMLSRDILDMDVKAEEVYAFGFHVIQKLAK